MMSMHSKPAGKGKSVVSVYAAWHKKKNTIANSFNQDRCSTMSIDAVQGMTSTERLAQKLGNQLFA